MDELNQAEHQDGRPGWVPKLTRIHVSKQKAGKQRICSECWHKIIKVEKFILVYIRKNLYCNLCQPCAKKKFRSFRLMSKEIEEIEARHTAERVLEDL